MLVKACSYLVIDFLDKKPEWDEAKTLPQTRTAKGIKITFFFIYFILINQKVTTVLILLYVSSKPLLISSILIFEVISVSISLRSSIYQSTIIGTSVLPRIPPNAETFHVRPCHKLKWSGTNLLTSTSKTYYHTLDPTLLGATLKPYA